MKSAVLFLSSWLLLTFAYVGQATADRLVWIDDGTRKIQSAALDGSGVTDVVALATNVNNHHLILAIDSTLQRAYYFVGGSPGPARGLRRVPLGGGVPDSLSSETELLQGLAVDSAAGTLYRVTLATLSSELIRSDLDAAAGATLWSYVNGGVAISHDLDASCLVSAGIVCGDLDMAGVVVAADFADTGTIGDLEIDGVGGHVYWSSQLEGGSIKRANVSGGGVITVAPGVGFSPGIAIDEVGRKLYWTSPFTGEITRANLDGSSVEVVVPGLSEPTDVEIAVGVPSVPLATAPTRALLAIALSSLGLAAALRRSASRRIV